MLGYLEMEPLPKAIATIADFQESEKRHRDSNKLAGRQLILGYGMFGLALATLWANFFD